MPKRTFKDKMTIGKGPDQIDLYYFGPAHTGGDAFVAFPAHRIMHVGDTFPNKALPIMDKNNGGAGIEYANTLMKAVKGVPNIDWIINGHTPAQTTPADMKEFAEFVREFVTTFRRRRRPGRPSTTSSRLGDAGEVQGIRPRARRAARRGRRASDFRRDEIAVRNQRSGISPICC